MIANEIFWFWIYFCFRKSNANAFFLNCLNENKTFQLYFLPQRNQRSLTNLQLISSRDWWIELQQNKYTFLIEISDDGALVRVPINLQSNCGRLISHLTYEMLKNEENLPSCLHFLNDRLGWVVAETIAFTCKPIENFVSR